MLLRTLTKILWGPGPGDRLGINAPDLFTNEARVLLAYFQLLLQASNRWYTTYRIAAIVMVLRVPVGHSPIADFYRPCSRGDNTFGSVCVCVRLSMGALLFEMFDLWPWFLAWGSILTLASLGLYVKGQGQIVKIVYTLPFEPVVRSRLLLDSACRVQPMVIAHARHQSTGIVYLLVIRGRSTCCA